MKAQKKWNMQHMRTISIMLSLEKDKDILSWWCRLEPGKKAETFRKMARKEIGK